MARIRLVLMLYFFMVFPQSCMANPVKGLLEVYEDMVEVFLVLETFPVSYTHLTLPTSDGV